MKTAARVLAAAALAAFTFPALAQGGNVMVTGIRPSSPVKLDPAALKSIQLGPAPSAAEQVDAALADVKTRADLAKTARAQYEAQEKTCSGQTYSAQDMRDAGCLDTDTVAACNRKLYRHCLLPATRRYQGNVLLFRRALEILDTKARALVFAPEVQ